MKTKTFLLIIIVQFICFNSYSEGIIKVKETNIATNQESKPSSVCSYYGEFQSINTYGTSVVITCSRPPYPLCFKQYEWEDENRGKIEIYKNSIILESHDITSQYSISATDASVVFEGTLMD